jgi:uncharacterized protein (TIGR03086 family)
MSDLRELHRLGAERFDQQVQQISPDQWRAPTPCAEWDVRALVNHLVYENVWALDLMAGRTVAEVGDRHEGDLLGDDPKATWRTSRDAAVDAFAAADALERTVHLSMGDVPGSEYLGQLTTDLTIHTWDLGKALGTDVDLDDELVSFVWDIWKPREELVRASGAFGDQVDVPDDADQQTKLLALLGRRRDWRP